MTKFITYSKATNSVNGFDGSPLYSLDILGATFDYAFGHVINYINQTIDVTLLEIPFSGTTFGTDTTGDIVYHAGDLPQYLAVTVSSNVVYGPTSVGDQVYNTDYQNWWDNYNTAFYTILHETIHSIGRITGIGGDHSNNPNHVMFPSADFNNPKTEMHPDEIYQYAVTLGYGYDPTNHVKIDGFEGQIYGAYNVVLGREVENSGLIHHYNLLENNSIDIFELYDSFTNSQEFQNRYGSLDNSEFVAQMYINALGRSGSQSEINDWAYLLDTNQVDKGDVAQGFGLSQEYVSNLHSQFDTTMWYEIT